MCKVQDATESEHEIKAMSVLAAHYQFRQNFLQRMHSLRIPGKLSSFFRFFLYK